MPLSDTDYTNIPGLAFLDLRVCIADSLLEGHDKDTLAEVASRGATAALHAYLEGSK